MSRRRLRPPSVAIRAEKETSHTEASAGAAFHRLDEGWRTRPDAARSVPQVFRLRGPSTCEPQIVAGHDPSPQHSLLPWSWPATKIALPAVVLAVALTFAGGSAAAPRLCVIVDPVVAIGCVAGERARAQEVGEDRGRGASPAEEAVASSSTLAEYDPGRIAVVRERGAQAAAVRAAFARAGVVLERALPEIDSYVVRVDPDRQPAAARFLRASRAIDEAEPEVVAHALDTTPDDDEWPLQTGLRLVGFPRAWDLSRGSAAVVVAVVDTGVDPNHPDVRGALVPGINLVDTAAPPVDDQGHGTAVAGIVAARADNKQGMAGTCWFCSVMPVKVLDRTGSGGDTRIAAGIVWATDHGAQVINLSLGGPGASRTLAAALGYARSRGAIVVAAAGNSGSTTPFYPAADTNALSVAGTTTTDRAYSWSNFGAWVDVAAPGCNVAPRLGGGFRTFCGTSSAAPIVSGLAALALSIAPAATSGEIADAIRRESAALPDLVHFGRIDAPRALAALQPSGAALVVTRTGTLTPRRRSLTFDFQASAGTFGAKVRSPAASRLTVTLRSLETGTLLLRRSASTSVELSRFVPGPVRLTVTSARRRVRVLVTASYGGVP
jgi:subtilisin family serine protease